MSGSYGQLVPPTADTNANLTTQDVAGNKDDTKNGSSLMAKAKGNAENIQKLQEWLVSDGIPTFPMPQQAGDGVSIAEVLRYVSDKQLSHTTIKMLPNMTGQDDAAVFTVMGKVMVRVVGFVGATPITSTSGTTTISIGTQADPDAIIPATVIDNSDFAVNDVWTDNNPEDNAATLSSNWVVINNASIYITRSVDDILGGELELVCEWRRLNDSGNVQPAA